PFSQGNEGFLSWLSSMGREETPPLVSSLSYADVEVSTVHPASLEYALRMEDEFVKMGLRGLTIIAASGDDGSAGPALQGSWDKGGSGGLGVTKAVSQACKSSTPLWPASSPYVTRLSWGLGTRGGGEGAGG
ncbi:unnamed protein product, partial [Discosporangium mesarthrocarpum]